MNRLEGVSSRDLCWSLRLQASWSGLSYFLGNSLSDSDMPAVPTAYIGLGKREPT